MAYQGTDRQAELVTLNEELLFTQSKIQKEIDPAAIQCLEKQIVQIRKNILHYS